MKARHLTTPALAFVLVALGISSGCGHAPAAAPARSDLGLALRRSGGQLLLKWSTEITPVRTAQAAMLAIDDGDRHEDVALALDHVRAGQLAYTPISRDVAFRLELTTPQGSYAESVRFLAGTLPVRYESAPAPATIAPPPAAAMPETHPAPDPEPVKTEASAEPALELQP